jgi:hypothetical protein
LPPATSLVPPATSVVSAPSATSVVSAPAQYKMSLELMERPADTIPKELVAMGIDQTQWNKIRADIEAGKSQNPCYNCPWCEVCYWCVPGACLQTCLCFLNPCSWYIISRTQAGHAQATKVINEDLERAGLPGRYKVSEGMAGYNAVFYTGPEP